MKRLLIPAVAGLLVVHAGFAGVTSLSHVFSPGKTLLDLDGDGLAEKPVLSIIIPDRPTSRELALAADISARANLESLALDFGLVRRASEAGDFESLPFPILIGARLAWAAEALRDLKIDAAALGPNQGLVVLFSRNGRPGIACIAGSDEALLATGRAFFLRWPYLWEIWGRETGATYDRIEADLAAFLGGEAVAPGETIIRQALYEFPVRPAAANALRAFAFDQGQIRSLTVEARFADGTGREKARTALAALADGHRRGLRTDVLTYAGCAGITFELVSGKSSSLVVIPRVGATKRLLTPAFRERPATDPEGKDFDMLGLAGTKGFYSDQDKDGIMDGLDASVIIPEGSSPAAVTDLAVRLMLGAAGAAFPVVIVDSEVESRRALGAPILVGPNALTRDLVKTGKLKLPALPEGWGFVRVVPKAFGKSNALVLYGADAAGLDKTLEYFSRTFPRFDDFLDGRPQFQDVANEFEKLLKGEKGAAEAYLLGRLEKSAAEMSGKDLETFEARFLLPRANPAFEAAVRKLLKDSLHVPSLTVSGTTLRSGKTVFEKEKSFLWESDEVLALIKEKIGGVGRPAAGKGPVIVSVGVSESLSVRRKLRDRIEAALAESRIQGAEVEVLSAYKPGYSWLAEDVLPRLKDKGVARLMIRFAETREDLARPKRTYAEPARWLQELYPVDELLARELRIPLENVAFEMKAPEEPVYEVEAYDAKDARVFSSRFTPRMRESALIDALPEWGPVRMTTGWLRLEAGGAVLADVPVQTDLERFWTFYQEEVLKPVRAFILKKTGQEPTFSKQPYFKRLEVELWASEPDAKTGPDEEIMSSLEAIHDEIYFDTLDMLRGMTGFDADDKDLPADASRSSAPGNVLPRIHPSLEGGAPRVKVTFEDWPGSSPEIALKWKEKGGAEGSKTIAFPVLKPKETRFAGFLYNGREDRIADLFIETDWEKEADYTSLIDILEGCRAAGERGLVVDPFDFPRLRQIAVRLKFQDRDKEEPVTVVNTAPAPGSAPLPAAPGPDEAVVPTRDIISPEMAAAIAARLSRLAGVRSYTGGRSYEGREVPVIELYLPLAKYVSLPRLATFKPTLQVSARQHANEVSSTNYLLKFVELTARDAAYREAVKKVNFALEPVENPDGAELAYDLQKTEPFHSLHAGRYGTLGVDVGSQSGSQPVLPEAAVRTNLGSRWAPDIYLNLHGYPSHEWVQPFSNYTPYLFRDYWIPKGWFTYFRYLTLPIYQAFKDAGDELEGFIARELRSDTAFAESNRRLYDRYRRWAARWAPHMDFLEITDGVDIYAKRRSSTENKLTARSRTTYVEETPEVMDETASGDWLDFLCAEGLAYLRAHVKYLAEARFEIVRLEEEAQGRVRIAFLRGRPAPVRKEKGNAPEPE